MGHDIGLGASRMRREARRDFGQAADQLGAIADRLSKRALDVTTPVYATSGNGKPRHQGSAILLRLGEIRFLLSAGHVLETISEQELSASADGIVSPIVGEVTRVAGTNTTRSDEDRVDIRFVRLAGPKWDSVPLSRFLHWDELESRRPSRPTVRQCGGCSWGSSSSSNRSIGGNAVARTLARGLGPRITRWS